MKRLIELNTQYSFSAVPGMNIADSQSVSTDMLRGTNDALRSCFGIADVSITEDDAQLLGTGDFSEPAIPRTQ